MTVPKDLEDKIEAFKQRLNRGSYEGSLIVAQQTIQILMRIVSHTKWANARELLRTVSTEGRKLMAVQPSESVVGNMVRRVLKIIREEYHASDEKHMDEKDTQESLHKLLLADETEDDYSQPKPNMISRVQQSIQELLSELETSSDSIAAQAPEHIHASEIIMTAGHSRTVEAFLLRAAKKDKREQPKGPLKFHVIVAECAPFYSGHELAVRLAEAGIETTVITDSAIFAMMSRCNKVIVGTHSVMADGGLKALSGIHSLALAAKHHSVPLIVCTSLYKLCPLYQYSCDQDTFNKFVNPKDVLAYEDGQEMSTTIVNPVFDYIPPHLVTLYVTNIGGHAPSYVYRLLGELYHPSDYELDSGERPNLDTSPSEPAAAAACDGTRRVAEAPA